MCALESADIGSGGRRRSVGASDDVYTKRPNARYLRLSTPEGYGHPPEATERKERASRAFLPAPVWPRLDWHMPLPGKRTRSGLARVGGVVVVSDGHAITSLPNVLPGPSRSRSYGRASGRPVGGNIRGHLSQAALPRRAYDSGGPDFPVEHQGWEDGHSGAPRGGMGRAGGDSTTTRWGRGPR